MTKGVTQTLERSFYFSTYSIFLPRHNRPMINTQLIFLFCTRYKQGVGVKLPCMTTQTKQETYSQHFAQSFHRLLVGVTRQMCEFGALHRPCHFSVYDREEKQFVRSTQSTRMFHDSSLRQMDHETMDKSLLKVTNYEKAFTFILGAPAGNERHSWHM